MQAVRYTVLWCREPTHMNHDMSNCSFRNQNENDWPLKDVSTGQEKCKVYNLRSFGQKFQVRTHKPEGLASTQNQPLLKNKSCSCFIINVSLCSN
uniref:Uncharacterized protein n=1 Tax=Arundo donax TaxID=35708 RepID=A0A0A9DWH4_ARUDO